MSLSVTWSRLRTCLWSWSHSFRFDTDYFTTSEVHLFGLSILVFPWVIILPWGVKIKWRSPECYFYLFLGEHEGRPPPLFVGKTLNGFIRQALFLTRAIFNKMVSNWSTPKWPRIDWTPSPLWVEVGGNRWDRVGSSRSPMILLKHFKCPVSVSEWLWLWMSILISCRGRGRGRYYNDFRINGVIENGSWSTGGMLFFNVLYDFLFVVLDCTDFLVVLVSV